MGGSTQTQLLGDSVECFVSFSFSSWPRGSRMRCWLPAARLLRPAVCSSCIHASWRGVDSPLLFVGCFCLVFYYAVSFRTLRLASCPILCVRAGYLVYAVILCLPMPSQKRSARWSMLYYVLGVEFLLRLMSPDISWKKSQSYYISSTGRRQRVTTSALLRSW